MGKNYIGHILQPASLEQVRLFFMKTQIFTVEKGVNSKIAHFTCWEKGRGQLKFEDKYAIKLT